MDKTKKWYIALSITITTIFVVLGVTVFYKSFVRLGETFGDIFSSVRFYVCEIFGIEHTITPSVIEKSKVLEWNYILPETSEGFGQKSRLFFRLMLNGKNFAGFTVVLGEKAENFSRVMVLLLPVFLLGWVIITRVYGASNTKHNKDTRPLRIFKGISALIYQPLKRFFIGYKGYLESETRWKTGWLWIWAFNLNLTSIFVAFIAFYLYFAVSFDFRSIYGQFCNLFLDIEVVLKHFPWFLSGTIAWLIFSRMREKIALRILRHHEARDCGFIKELPIVTMTCAPMGMKKTTTTTDMSLSQTVMFRQEAFMRLQKQDMKFPFFSWICFEDEIKKCMEYGRIYNLASIKTWIEQKRARYEKHGDAALQLYGYDGGRYGFTYDTGLKVEELFDVLETYAKLYFIYVIESSLLVANYSIREDFVLYDMGNFPLWNFDFFPKRYPANSRFAHILDFDVLRLGRKVIENNPKAGSFEFGVVVITEVGKERANNLELKEIKKGADEANQKNDLFNSWLKMCRHAATVDNFPFIKVFTDEQRPESWGADARDLCDILTITNSGKQKLALPFYTIEEMLCEWAFSRFISMYYDFRYRRGDNTLLVYVLKAIVGKIYTHNERIYNRYGYCVLSLERERGTREGKPKKKKYYLSNYKIYRERFKTDCFADHFNALAEQSKIGLMDYICYASVKASVDELKQQNSYFINGLYGA